MKYYPDVRNFSLFDDWFDNDFFSATPSRWMKTDITETDDGYQLNMELPGIRKEDIQIQLKNGTLQISASRSNNNEDKDAAGRIVRQERFTGTVSRSFYVGDTVHESDIKAAFENGELKITLPKEAHRHKEEQKYIPVE